MTQTTTLHDFKDIEPLAIKEKVPVKANGMILGWAGPSNREQNILVSYRHRYEYDGGKQDYYRKIGGYSYDDIALKAMKQIGGERVAVREVDNNRIIEYGIDSFFDLGEPTVVHNEVTDGKTKTNYCLPVSAAIHTWDEEECRIIKDHA